MRVPHGQCAAPANTRLRRAALAIAFLSCAISGCETLNPITLGVGLASYAATGKGLADHAIGTLMQSDCNILDGLLSAERKICEPLDSAVSRGGFRGLFAGARTVEPQLKLSEHRVQSTPALDAMSFSEVDDGPALRLTDAILPDVQAATHRVAARPAVPGSTQPL